MAFFEDLIETVQVKRRKKVSKLYSETDLLIIDDLFLRKIVPENTPDDLLNRFQTGILKITDHTIPMGERMMRFKYGNAFYPIGF